MMLAMTFLVSGLSLLIWIVLLVARGVDRKSVV